MVAGGSILCTIVSTNGVGAGAIYVSNNISQAENNAAAAVNKVIGAGARGKSGTSTPKTVPQQLTRSGQVPTIGKMKDLNTPGNVVNGEFKIADYLPNLGNPKANWHQNSGILRSVMNEGVPIKDVSMFPMDNAGFLGAERYLLQSRGWEYFEGYWYPPQ